MKSNLFTHTVVLVSSLWTMSAFAAGKGACDGLPSHDLLQKTLVEVSQSGNGGLFTPNAMWATVVGRDGSVCAVAKTGDAWPGSRVISAQKANTANAFSNDHLALSSANLYSPVQPGGSLFGLQLSNPVDTKEAYAGKAVDWGTAKDGAVGKRLGGVNVFGGGLALYRAGNKTVLGGIGVSGDTSCTDHIIAWRIRSALHLDIVPGGVSAAGDDNIIHDIAENGKSTGGFGHPACSPQATELAKALKVSAKQK